MRSLLKVGLFFVFYLLYMKHTSIQRSLIVIICLFLAMLAHVQGQELIRADTVEYEQQRQKVNELLQQRSARFGQYEESLMQRTGIFGLKTRKDMQASIDILKEIVLTDNHIFRETKQLVDFKDFEKEMIARQAREFDSRINGYIATISKLQKEQVALREQVEALQAKQQRSSSTAIFILVVGAIVAVLVYMYYIRPKRAKAKTPPIAEKG